MDSGALGRPAATSECNEGNEALQTARDLLALARRLAFVAGNALANGDPHGVRAALTDLQAASQSGRLASSRSQSRRASPVPGVGVSGILNG
jgi:hypothetical protein